MRVKFIKNYEKGDRVILKGTEVEVMPWFFKELAEGKYVAIENKVIETTMKDIKKETR